MTTQKTYRLKCLVGNDSKWSWFTNFCLLFSGLFSQRIFIDSHANSVIMLILMCQRLKRHPFSKSQHAHVGAIKAW